MSKTIKKYEQLPASVKEQMKQTGEEFAIGDMFFKGHRDGTIIRVRELQEESRWTDNGKKKEKYWKVYCDHATTWDASEWSGYGSYDVDDFLKYIKEGNISKITRPLSEILDEANKVIAGEIPISVYAQNEYSDSMSEERAIMSKNSKSTLQAIEKSLTDKKKSADLIHKAIGYEMERRKQELEEIKDNLYAVVAVFEKQVKKIQRIITSIELYLGIEEELHQIQDGEKAPIDTPISFRQLVLFMDEEVGVHENGGIDFRDIKMFDEWLLKDNNIDIVLPEKKGIVVLNPRRHEKDYGHPYLNVFWNAENLYTTYILIRNGDCIYRIHTDKLTIRKRFFPRRKEMIELFEKMQKETWDRDKEKIEDKMYNYKKQAMLLQGLIDRTDVFKPLPVERLDISKLQENEHLVNFIYDDDSTSLTDGRPLFDKWRKQINSKIEEGSRIVITGEFGNLYSPGYGSRSSHNYEDRWYKMRNQYGDKKTYDMPSKGVYEVSKKYVKDTGEFPHYFIDELEEQGLLVEKGKQVYRFCEGWEKHDYNQKPKPGVQIRLCKDPSEKRNTTYIEAYQCTYMDEHLVIKYNPGGDVWTWDGDYHERKNKVSFRIYRDDKFVLNYDQLDYADIDYYLKSRVDRENYLTTMPFLKEARKNLLVEMANEKEFIRFIADRNQNKLSGLTRKKVEDKVTEAVNWWKYKNKWKRAITKDDTLALRMIEKKILNKK